MSENTHYERAKSRLHNGTNNEVARAQVEATLALAYEQRTANLIAVFNGQHGIADDLEDLANDIRERLGFA